MPSSQAKRNTPGVFILIIAHLAIALPLAYLLTIWTDEASTLNATGDGFWHAFQTAAIEQKQAPLYFWVMSIWRLMNDSIFFARLFSVLCSVAAIWLFSRLAGRVLGEKAGLLATAFFALHPFLFWASTEIRVYSLVILLSIALIDAFLHAFWDDEKSAAWPKVKFGLLALAALYTNYYLGGMLAALLLPLLLFRRWRSAASYVGIMAIVGLAFLPMVFHVRAELDSRSSSFLADRSLISGLKLLWGHVLTFWLPTEIYPSGTTSTASVARLWIVRAAVAGVAIFAAARWRRISNLTIVLGSITAGVLGFLLVAYFLVGGWLVVIRHASLLFPAVVLFTASLIKDLFSETSRTRLFNVAVPAAGLIVLAAFSYTLLTLYPNYTKPGDWARVAAFIEQNETAGQPIILFHTYDALSLPYYYRGKNRILPDERYFEFDFGTPTPERTRKRTEFTISKIPADAPEIWLLVHRECDQPDICGPFEEFVAPNYTVVLEQQFYGQKVYLLRKRT